MSFIFVLFYRSALAGWAEKFMRHKLWVREKADSQMGITFYTHN